ncbi:MAG TPA: DUF1304 domain-containing protein [Anaerolineae bacterium]|nr:DUF1304 domain-containing protein [Anaerolineae bacterium]
MSLIALILTTLVALEHIYILILEMFLWTKPQGRRAFGLSAEDAATTQTLAANQGLYNGFLAAGLFWGLLHPNPDFSYQIKLFFLLCVFIAGLYGGATAKRTILYIQALPALLALLAVFIAGA